MNLEKDSAHFGSSPKATEPSPNATRMIDRSKTMDGSKHVSIEVAGNDKDAANDLAMFVQPESSVVGRLDLAKQPISETISQRRNDIKFARDVFEQS